MLTKFWQVLFDFNENIVMTDSVTRTQTQSGQFFCINPTDGGGRKDSNITVFRNILIEFDSVPIHQQVDLVRKSGMPFSTIVFSGNKSYHFIISLETPMPDLAAYRRLVERIHAKLPDADKSTKNPGRLSRTPDYRRDTGQMQHLAQVNCRISTEALDAWLGPDLKTEESKASQVVRAPMGTGKYRLLPTRVLAFIEYGANEGSRNRALFTSACELFRANYEAEAIFAIAIKVLDLPVIEIRQCIESARKAVTNEI